MSEHMGDPYVAIKYRYQVTKCPARTELNSWEGGQGHQRSAAPSEDAQRRVLTRPPLALHRLPRSLGFFCSSFGRKTGILEPPLTKCEAGAETRPGRRAVVERVEVMVSPPGRQCRAGSPWGQLGAPRTVQHRVQVRLPSIPALLTESVKMGPFY